MCMKKLWLFVAFELPRAKQIPFMRNLKRQLRSVIFKSMQTVRMWGGRVRLCVESYHIELFPHGTPVPQRRCHLCDDRVFNRDDRLKLPTNTHTCMRIQFKPLPRHKGMGKNMAWLTLYSWRGHSSSGCSWMGRSPLERRWTAQWEALLMLSKSFTFSAISI